MKSIIMGCSSIGGLVLILSILIWSALWIQAGSVIEETSLNSLKPSEEVSLSSGEEKIIHTLWNSELSDSGFICPALKSVRNPRRPIERSVPTLTHASSGLANRAVFRLRTERSLHRGLLRLATACRLESKYAGSALARQYLSTAYVGNSEYGASVAAHSIFNKSVDDLTDDEIAHIAALIILPIYRNRPEKLERRKIYLRDRRL